MRKPIATFCTLVGIVCAAPPVTAESDDELTAAEREFFETRIRPVLVTHCYSCHSAFAKTVKGELRLDTREGILRGGASGAAIVAGRPDDSLLLMAVRHDGLEMPPSERLDDRVIADFEEWIRRGAAVPATKAHSIDKFDLEQRRRDHWAWHAIRATHRSIDQLIRTRLALEGLALSEPAAPRTLLRRLKFDLLGLPPTRKEVAEFLEAPEQNYVRFVDRWLASPHFGEKWAVHWLDVVRFAETKGHVTDQLRPYAWKYRDYVVNAFNDDLPYDEFVREQIAGDLLRPRPGRNGRTNVAPAGTGVLFMHEMHFMAVDPVKQRWDEIDAQIDTLGKAVLGLTLGCARCHDHKFDAISQADYYALAGFFYSTEQGTHRTGDRIDSHAALPDVRKTEKAYQDFLRKKIGERKRAQSPKASEYFPISDELGFTAPGETKRLLAFVQKLERLDPSWSRWVRAAKDVKGKDVRLLERGEHSQPRDVVPRRFLTAVGEAVPTQNELGGGSGRLWLAHQMTQRTNPLTARVWVNRLWQHLFGRGIVGTPNNFGLLGDSPTHPQLLDALAVRLIETGWSTKAVIRDIVLSDSYRQSSETSLVAQRADPSNRWFSRQNRRRLPAESIRDNVLWISGRLNRTMAGRSLAFFVPPYRTANKPTNVAPSGPLDGNGRRSLYLVVRRNFFAPMLRVFDFPNRDRSLGLRTETITPNQALAKLNSPLFHALAKRWAMDVAQRQGTVEHRIASMFERATGRPPSDEERRILAALTADLEALHGESSPTFWTGIAHTVLNLDEVIVID